MKLEWSNKVFNLNWDDAVATVKQYSEKKDKSDLGQWRLPSIDELPNYVLQKKNIELDTLFWTDYQGKTSSLACFLKNNSSCFSHKKNLENCVFVREVEEQSREPFWEIRDLKDVQEKSALQDDYNLGLYNGIELCLAILEKREPKYKDLKSKEINRYRIDVISKPKNNFIINENNFEITGMKYELEDTGNWVQYNDVRNLVEKQNAIISGIYKLLKDIRNTE